MCAILSTCPPCTIKTGDGHPSARRTHMATFNLTVPGSFPAGTAAADTFNLGAGHLTVLGLDGDDVFLESVVTEGSSYLDGGNGNDSFTMKDFSIQNYLLGGDGNDS